MIEELKPVVYYAIVVGLVMVLLCSILTPLLRGW